MSDLLKHMLEIAHGPAKNARIPVIVQFSNRADASFESDLANNGGQVKSHFANLNAKLIEIPAKAAEALAVRAGVGFVSLNRASLPVGHVTATTGADLIRVTKG